MSEFLKPQSPLKHKDGAFVYPLTTADQVILDDNNRLNFALENMVYASEEYQEDATTPLDADTLGGHPVEDFVQVEAFETYAGSIDANIKENTRPKAGFIYPLASSTVPDGFLLCDGAEYLRAQYPELFAAIGTIYGEGDGSTTFNVPNLQTRVPIGAGDGYELGSVGGEATHTLTVDEMPKHNHFHNNFQNGYPTNYTGAENYTTPVTHHETTREESKNYPNTDTQYTGGSQPHNNMQPYTVVSYIIATGKDTGVSVSDIIIGAQALPLGVEYGGTGATNAENARKNLGAVSECSVVNNFTTTEEGYVADARALKTLNDKIEADTGWLTTTNGYFQYRYKSGIVHIKNSTAFPSVAAGTWGILDSVPSKYAPGVQLAFPSLSGSSLNYNSEVLLTPTGEIRVWCASTAITGVNGTWSYPI